MSSTEVGYPPSQFADVYARAAAEGLHSSRTPARRPPEYVREAVEVLGVERVDHGNRAIEDPELGPATSSTWMPLTVCPLSNVALRTAPREFVAASAARNARGRTRS